MFHQVFICDATQDSDSSKVLSPEQSTGNDILQTLKQENTTSGYPTMGYLQAEDLKMAIEELKFEKCNVKNNQIVMKTSTEITQVGVESMDFVNITPSSENTVSPLINLEVEQNIIGLGEQKLVLPLVSGEAIQPLLCPTITKFEPLSSLSDGVLSRISVEELKGEKIDKTNSELNIKTDNLLKDDPYSVLADSGDTEVQNDEVKLQEGNSNNNLKILQKDLRYTEKETKEAISEITDAVPKLQYPKSYNIKECRVLIKDCISEYITPEVVPDIRLDSTSLPVLGEHEDNSYSDWEAEETVIDDSSGSDWEEEYLIKSKTQEKIKKEISKKSKNVNQNMNTIDNSIHKNTTCIRSLDLTSNKLYNYLETSSTEKSTTKTKTINATSTSSLQKRLPNSVTSSDSVTGSSSVEPSTISHNQRNVSNSSKHLPSPNPDTTKNSTLTNLMLSGPMNDTDKTTFSSEKYSFQLQLPVQSTTNNITLHFIQRSKIMNVTNLLKDSGKTIQAQTVTFTKIQPINPHRNEKKILKNDSICSQVESKLHFIPPKNNVSITDTQKYSNKNYQDKTVTCAKVQPVVSNKKIKKSHDNTISTEVESRQNSNYISPHSAQNNTIGKKSKSPRFILPKPRSVPSSSKIVGIEDAISSGTPFDEQRVSIDNFEDDDDESENEPIFPQYTYHCNKCDTYFEIVDKFLHHRRYSLCGGHRREARHRCSICDKLFTSREKMESHKNSHTNARPFKCFDCDKYFNSKAARQMHHKKMHLNIKTRYLCCFCAYTTPSPEHILAHEEEHRVPEGSEIPKPFKCLDCGKGFISLWKLQKHKREHKLKKCAKCPEKFKTQTQLINHMEAVHSVIKTYDCKECGQKFRHPGTLRDHRKIHSSVLTYFCDVCDKGFKRKNNLKQHMITHSDERPISCSECGDSFKRITHLKQHIAAIHGDGRK